MIHVQVASAVLARSGMPSGYTVIVTACSGEPSRDPAESPNPISSLSRPTPMSDDARMAKVSAGRLSAVAVAVVVVGTAFVGSAASPSPEQETIRNAATIGAVARVRYRHGRPE